MNAPALFSLTRNGVPLLQLPLGPAEILAGVDDAPLVHEQQQCGFQVEGREPDVEYQLRLGDRDALSSEELAGIRNVGVARRRDVVWDDAMYFAGTRGRVWVHLASRAEGSDQAWQPRARVPVVVRAHKLSAERYQTMLTQIRGLAAGLLFDLVSPMLRSLGFGAVEGAVSPRSSQIELRLLERLWSSLARSLEEIVKEPVTRITRSGEFRMAWGGERLSARATAGLAATGVDPRRRGAVRPFRMLLERNIEDCNTVEHQVIAGLLDFLRVRVAACADNVQRHIAGIQADRPYRSAPPPGASSLYEDEDLPRLRQLQVARRRAGQLGQHIVRAQQIDLFRGVQPRFVLPNTPVFTYVRPYRRVRDEFRRYLGSSLILLDDGYEERLKSTQRLYEQWIFFQLAAALRRAGLSCVSHDGLFHRSHRFRFTLDVDRGASLRFSAQAGAAVVIRFEPWVLPYPAAQQRGETVYRGRHGEAPWSPDVLMEFLDAEGEVRYAVVVDAKYTGRIQEHHWADTRKYLEIRATRTRRAVVKQVWLAYPSEQEEIVPEDSALTWTETGPDWDPSEIAMGRLGFIPARQAPSAEAEEPGWIAVPEPTVQAFVFGLLRFLQIPHESKVHERVEGSL